MPFALLLAMQAAGMVYDYMGTKRQEAFNQMGEKVQNAGIEANIYQTRLETEEASLASLHQLRQTIGTQIAIMAATGRSTVGGTSQSIFAESIGNANADERVRRLNQMGRENQLQAGKVQSMLTSQSENSKLWQGFASRSLNSLSSNPDVYKKTASYFGLTQA